MAIVKGTIKELVGRVEINGNVLSQPELSILTRVLEGIAFRKVGEIKVEGKRGRPTNIWELDTDAHVSLSLNDDTVPDPV